MESAWPPNGVWLIVRPSAALDWQLAAAALAAAAEVRVAVLVIGPTAPPSAMLIAQGVTWSQAHAGSRFADIETVLKALQAKHGLVLITAAAGVIAPAGPGGWSLSELGRAAVVLAGPGPDAVNHTTLALAALTARGIPATVVTIGATDDELPIAAAGRIPAGFTSHTGQPPHPAPPRESPPANRAAESPPANRAAESPPANGAAESPPADKAQQSPPAGGRNAGIGAAEFKAAARTWLDPVLHAKAGPRPTIAEPQRTAKGSRVVLALLGVFLVAALLACGLAYANRTPERPQARYSTTITTDTAPRPVDPAPWRRTVTPPPVQVGVVCPEFELGVVPARADRATRLRVGKAWTRIETWLGRNAPQTLAKLRRPAEQADIDEAQRRMSVTFPPDLVASLLRHNGVAQMEKILPPFYIPQPVDSIVGNWQTTCEVQAAAGDVDRGWWTKGFVPFAYDGSGGALVLDQNPGGHGRVGEFYPEDGTRFERWPGSLSELLEMTATSLETGKAFDGRYRPHPTPQGTLDWEILAGR